MNYIFLLIGIILLCTFVTSSSSAAASAFLHVLISWRRILGESCYVWSTNVTNFARHNKVGFDYLVILDKIDDVDLLKLAFF